jgi:hypothetical protein
LPSGPAEEHEADSPRTQRLHVAQHLYCVGAICLVGSQFRGFGAYGRGSLSTCGLDDRGPNNGRYGCAIAGQDGKRARRILVRPEGDRDSYAADLGKRIFVVLLQSDVGTDTDTLEWQPT